MKKKHPVLRNMLLDAAAAGLALTVFALFHHVLPNRQQSLNLQTVRPATAQTATTPETETVQEAQAEQKADTAREAAAAQETEETFRPEMRMSASAGTSDTGWGGRSGRSGGRGSGKGSGIAIFRSVRSRRSNRRPCRPEG